MLFLILALYCVSFAVSTAFRSTETPEYRVYTVTRGPPAISPEEYEKILREVGGTLQPFTGPQTVWWCRYKNGVFTGNACGQTSTTTSTSASIDYEDTAAATTTSSSSTSSTGSSRTKPQSSSIQPSSPSSLALHSSVAPRRQVRPIVQTRRPMALSPEQIAQIEKESGGTLQPFTGPRTVWWCRYEYGVYTGNACGNTATVSNKSTPPATTTAQTPTSSTDYNSRLPPASSSPEAGESLNPWKDRAIGALAATLVWVLLLLLHRCWIRRRKQDAHTVRDSHQLLRLVRETKTEV